MRLHSLALVLALAWGSAQAQTVDIKDAWVRTPVQGQKSTGAFMKITARENLKLVSVSTPVAGVAEVHEMKMDGNVMRMRELEKGIEIPPGATVELKPGGFHIMFMGLKAPFARDAKVPLTLVFEKAGSIDVELQVAAMGAGAPAPKH